MTPKQLDARRFDLMARLRGIAVETHNQELLTLTNEVDDFIKRILFDEETN